MSLKDRGYTHFRGRTNLQRAQKLLNIIEQLHDVIFLKLKNEQMINFIITAYFNYVTAFQLTIFKNVCSLRPASAHLHILTSRFLRTLILLVTKKLSILPKNATRVSFFRDILTNCFLRCRKWKFERIYFHSETLQYTM